MTLNETAATVARALLEIDAVVFTPDAPLTFKSGIKSPVYVDNRRVPFWPAQWRVVLDGFAQAARDRSFDVIAGIAVGGVPHSSALAYLLGAPSVFVRKEAKAHGTRSQIEGGDVSGKTVLLVEDLVTTGGSSLAGVEALRADGARVTDCLAIVSYGFAEAVDAFTVAGVTLTPLTTFDVLREEAGRLGKLTAAQIALVAAWQADPHGWAG